LSSFTLVEAGFAAGFSDLFSNRELITGGNVLVTGSNVGASLEPYEPLHAGKPGGRSVWISWLAPTNGLVTLSTEGSTFDTLLGVYTLEPGDDPPLKRLHEAAGDDDAGTTNFTALQFGARAGQRYEIAVDGFAGAAGDIRLSVGLFAIEGLLPSIVRRPGDQAVRVGDTLILTMDIEPTALLQVKWFFNEMEARNGDQPTLVVRNFQAADTGRYRLRLEVGDVKFFSAPIEVQINSEGLSATLARNKPEDALASGLGSGNGVGGGGSWRADPAVLLQAASVGDVARGYNGTQIFNSLYASRDPLEPRHCGVDGGASYWFSYVPPQDGQASFDTEGSDFETVLAVYTFNPPLSGYADLIPVACDGQNGSNGLPCRVQFAASGGRTYFVVVDGVNGARGIAQLNYRLEVSDPPSPLPVITRQPQSQVLARNNTVALEVVAAGEAPLSYQWHRNGQPLANETGAMLTLANVQPRDQGDYSVSVSNRAGVVFSAEARIDVQSNPSIRLGAVTGSTIAGFPALKGYQYRVESAPVLDSNAWGFLQYALTDGGGMIWITNSAGTLPVRFYRLSTP
jgi:Immunoglobulin domain